MYNVPQHSEVAVDVFGKIARSILNSNNFSAMHSITEYQVKPVLATSPMNKRFFNKLIAQMGYDTVAYETNSRYLLVLPEKTKDKNGKSGSQTIPVVKSVPLGKVEGVPNVQNMIGSDAVTELMRAGYKVALVGRGKVKTQVYDAATKTVKLYLE